LFWLVFLAVPAICAASAAQRTAVEDRRPHLVATNTASLSPVVRYQGLARRIVLPLGFLMRPLLNGGTSGGRHNGRRSEL
jgi:hypothetical protein